MQTTLQAHRLSIPEKKFEQDAAGMASLQFAGSQSSVTIASLVELMRSEQLISSVNHLKVQLDDGGTLSVRLDMADDGEGDACLVLKESTATILSLLSLEKRKRKIAEALLKQKPEPSRERIDTESFEQRLSGNVGGQGSMNELNSQIQNLVRRSTKLSNALKQAKDSQEQSELVAGIRQREVQAARTEIDRVQMIVEDVIVSQQREAQSLLQRIDNIQGQLKDKGRETEETEEALSEERSKRKALRARLVTTESVASKELSRMQKQSVAQSKELERLENESESARLESQLFQNAIGRLLQAVNDERAQTLSEEEDKKEEQREEEDGQGSVFSIGICAA